MANVIPMAGLGSRFAASGYRLPKALIPVSGRPMIVRAIESLPESEKWVFIVRKEHVTDYAVDALIRKEIPDAIIVPVAETTQGQAATCALALPYIASDEPIFIAACDNSFVYDKEKLGALRRDPNVDAIVWTFTKHPSLSAKPESWGWIKLHEDGETVDDVSVKVPVSATPDNDHAVVGAFYFRRSDDFKRAYDLMVAADLRTNGELYVDSIPVFYKQLGKRSVIFDVDLYVGWGKPEDLYLYQEQEYTVNAGLASSDPDFELWKTFIRSLR